MTGNIAWIAPIRFIVNIKTIIIILIDRIRYNLCIFTDSSLNTLWGAITIVIIVRWMISGCIPSPVSCHSLFIRIILHTVYYMVILHRSRRHTSTNIHDMLAIQYPSSFLFPNLLKITFLRFCQIESTAPQRYCTRPITIPPKTNRMICLFIFP